MALVDQHQAVAAQVGQFPEHPAHRQHAGAHPVAFAVVLPHRDEVPGAEDQRLQPVVVLEHPRQRGGHEGLAQADDVADDHAAPPVQVVRGDLHGGGLEVEEPVSEVPGNAELRQPGPRLLRQVVRHLDVDVMRRDRFLPRPAPPDDRGQLVRYVDAPAVVPALLEPRRELFAGVVVEHVDVELALTGQPGLREVAAAQIPDHRVGRVGPEQQVELGVQRMPEKQLHHDLPRPYLPRQPPQARLVLVGRGAERQLLPELLGQLLLQPQRRLVVERRPVGRQAPGRPQLLVRQPLHADEDAAAAAFAAGPALDVVVYRPPAPKIEIPDAEVGPVGHAHRFGQRRPEMLRDVVEDAGHARSRKLPAAAMTVKIEPVRPGARFRAAARLRLPALSAAGPADSARSRGRPPAGRRRGARG